MELYNVRIERTIMVVAENENEAERLALIAESDEAGNVPDFINIVEVSSMIDIPKEWRDSLPYGECSVNGEELTCENFFNNNQ